MIVKLMKIIKPVEYAFSELKSVIIRDSAVDAMCHGAQLGNSWHFENFLKSKERRSCWNLHTKRRSSCFS